MRLNKYIAHNSHYSRREADKLIFDGFIKIENKIIINPAIDVNENTNIFLKGKPLKKKIETTVIVYNKPKGELVTTKDPEGRKTIYHTLGNKFKGFRPVGRLDFTSEGVLILSDSIDIVESLMTSNLERVYRVKINSFVSHKIISAMENGLKINNSLKGANEKSNINNLNLLPFNWYEIIKNHPNYSIVKISLSEGKNREIRRFFANLDVDVLDLKRVSFGWINLNNLPTGKKRFFTKQEYIELRKFLKTKKKS
jgi:23S rRNA pseudouridine2605 synthase